MKKCVLQIFSFYFAIFIAFVSGGLNIYHYCCDACEELNQCSIHNAQHTIIDSQSPSSDECCSHHYKEEEIADWGNNKIKSNTNKCGLTRIEAPDFSHLNKKSVNFIAPLIATPITIHNSQVSIQDYEYKFFNKHGVPIAHDLSGRAIIVRKSAYLI